MKSLDSSRWNILCTSKIVFSRSWFSSNLIKTVLIDTCPTIFRFVESEKHCISIFYVFSNFLQLLFKEMKTKWVKPFRCFLLIFWNQSRRKNISLLLDFDWFNFVEEKSLLSKKCCVFRHKSQIEGPWSWKSHSGIVKAWKNRS